MEASPRDGDLRKDTPAISLLLWALWNPVSGGAFDVPLNEFDGYVPQVWKLLREGAGAPAVAEQLKSITEARMGGSLGTEERTAEALTQWWYWRYVYPKELER